MTDLARRTLLRGLVAGTLAGPALAACAPGPSSAVHPALAPPLDAVLVTALDVPDGAAGRAAALALLEAAGGADGTMVGVGASLFERVGAARPAELTPMPPFDGDVLDPARTHGDLLLHVEAGDADEARDRTADLLDGTGAAVRWRTAGHREGNTVAAGRPLVRNPFGYTEGHGNAPAGGAAAARDALLPPAPGRPAWLAGASLLAVRTIRLARELWDADPQEQQDRIIGRRRDGTWLDGRAATAEPAFAADPDGAVTPLDAHVRVVNPRTPGAPAPRLLRRSWAYAAGRTPEGQLDEGILFMAYQADFEAGFALAQRRLPGEAMTAYLLAVGGGYFAVPARRPAAGWESVLAGRPAG